jgi:hypothetical protein
MAGSVALLGATVNGGAAVIGEVSPPSSSGDSPIRFLRCYKSGAGSREGKSMTDKADHIAWAAEAIAVYQRHCRTGDEHAIADLICDLGHLAEERGFDFISEVRRGIGHWYAELHAKDRNDLGPDAAVEITINPR